MKLHYAANSYLEGYVYTDKDLCKLYIKEWQLESLYFIDVVVEDKVLVEVKATEKNHPIYETQVLTYLRLTGIKLGLLVNFGAPYVKDGVSRIINRTGFVSCFIVISTENLKRVL